MATSYLYSSSKPLFQPCPLSTHTIRSISSYCLTKIEIFFIYLFFETDKDSETEPGTLMVEAVEPPKGNNLSIWEDDPTERKKDQSNRDIVNQEMISKSNHDSNKTIMIRGENSISSFGKNRDNRYEAR